MLKLLCNYLQSGSSDRKHSYVARNIEYTCAFLTLSLSVSLFFFIILFEFLKAPECPQVFTSTSKIYSITAERDKERDIFILQCYRAG